MTRDALLARADSYRLDADRLRALDEPTLDTQGWAWVYDVVADELRKIANDPDVFPQVSGMMGPGSEAAPGGASTPDSQGLADCEGVD